MHIGNINDYERYPAVFLVKPGLGFSVCITPTTGEVCYRVATYAQTDTVYTLKIAFTQFSFTISVNDQIEHENTSWPYHDIPCSRNVYAGNPWGYAADVLITNIQIQGPGNLCIAYSPYFSEGINGNLYEYQGQHKHRPYWKSSTTERYIYWYKDFWKWNWGPEVGWNGHWDHALNDEIDSAFGAGYYEGIIISNKLCGYQDPNPPQDGQNVLVSIPNISGYFVIIALLIMTIINVLRCVKVIKMQQLLKM